MHSPSRKPYLPSAVISPKPMPSCLVEMRQRIVRTAQLAGQVGTHGQRVLAHRFEVVHMVESGHFIHSHLRHADKTAMSAISSVADPAFLVLHKTQCRHHRGLALVGRIFLQLFVDLACDLYRITLAVYLPKNDVLRTDDRDHVGDHVPARHFVQRRTNAQSRGRVSSCGKACSPRRRSDRCRTRPWDARPRHTPRRPAHAILR